jgi:hypothetical protein
VVYAKAPFGGPEQVLKHLSAYTHRSASGGSYLENQLNAGEADKGIARAARERA